MDDGHFLYPQLPPVEVGEWLRLEQSDAWFPQFVQVERLTPKLIHAGGMTFSREHGAAYDGFGIYDAYAGRVRKLTTDADRAEFRDYLRAEPKGDADER